MAPTQVLRTVCTRLDPKQFRHRILDGAHRVLFAALLDIVPAAVAHPEPQRQQHRPRALVARCNHQGAAPPRQRLLRGPAVTCLLWWAD